MSKIAGVEIRSTANNLTKDSRMCTFVYAEPKYGKTTMVGTLDALTKKHHNKPSLIIACEPSDGGGTASLRDKSIDFVTPSTMQELLAIISQLSTDTTYGGVAIDSLTEVVRRFFIPFSVKNMPAKMDTIARKQYGTPVGDDYNNAGELLRQTLNNLVALSSLPNLECRKHVVGTAIVRTKVDWQNKGEIIEVRPDVPGQMASTINAIFQTIGTIRQTRKGTEVNREFVTDITQPGYAKWILGDRFKVLPPVSECDLLEQYEKYWMPNLT